MGVETYASVLLLTKTRRLHSKGNENTEKKNKQINKIKMESKKPKSIGSNHYKRLNRLIIFPFNQSCKFFLLFRKPPLVGTKMGSSIAKLPKDPIKLKKKELK